MSISYSSLISEEPMPPSFEHPESINQLNTMLTYYNLPTFSSDDSNSEKLSKIKEFLKHPLVGQEISELPVIEQKLEKKDKYRKLEEECDRWEVEIANIRYCKSDKYLNKSVDELKGMIQELEERCMLFKEIEKYKDTLKGILEFNKVEISRLGYLKASAFGAYVKRKVIDKLIGRQEEWAVILSYIVKSNIVSVEQIKNDLGIERIAILRVVYNLCAKGILEYDRLEDTVSVK